MKYLIGMFFGFVLAVSLPANAQMFWYSIGQMNGQAAARAQAEADCKCPPSKQEEKK